MVQEQSLLKIVATVLRTAPRHTKVLVTLTPVLLFVLTGIVVVDLVGSDSPSARVQVWSLILGNAGLLLWSLAAVLYEASVSSPHRTDTSKANELFRQIWLSFLQFTSKLYPEEQRQKLHDVVLVLPIIAVAAGCLLAAASGILLPAIPQSPRLLVPALLYAFFVVLSVRTVSNSMRFLYGYAHEQADAAARARVQATEAQLSALHAQLNPHFLFNALNTVAALVRSNPRSAETTVDNLAQVLRRTLDRSRRTLCTLDDEVDYLKAYLSVEQERFGDRLTVEWSIDANTGSLKIPPMTLQPLVENSLKHGIGGRLQGGTLVIRSRLEDTILVLEVADDGAGFLPHHREGTGLRNLRERLATLYGDESALLVAGNGDGAGAGATVTVRIPTASKEVG